MIRKNRPQHSLDPSALEPLEGRLCMDSGTLDLAITRYASSGGVVLGEYANFQQINAAVQGNVVAWADSDGTTVRLEYALASASSFSFLVAMDDSGRPTGMLRLTKGPNGANIYTLVRNMPVEEKSEAPVETRRKKQPRQEPEPVPVKKEETPAETSPAIITPLPRAKVGDTSDAQDSQRPAIEAAEETAVVCIPAAGAEAKTSSPASASTWSDVPVQRAPVLTRVAGVAAESFAPREAITPAIARFAGAESALEQITEIPSIRGEAIKVMTVMAATPQRLFEYAPLNLPYILAVDSVAAFADRSASISAAVVARARAAGPWTLTIGVLAADLVALAYIHRRTLVRFVRAASALGESAHPSGRRFHFAD